MNAWANTGLVMSINPFLAPSLIPSIQAFLSFREDVGPTPPPCDNGKLIEGPREGRGDDDRL